MALAVAFFILIITNLNDFYHSMDQFINTDMTAATRARLASRYKNKNG